MIATEALPFLITMGTFTANDVQAQFGLTRADAMACLARLRKKGLIHTISRGGGATLSVYAMGPAPKPLTEWVPSLDMTRFLESLTATPR